MRMPTNISINPKFMYLSAGGDTVAVPYPAHDSGIFETSTMVDSGRNTDGVLVSQVIGRPIAKQNMKWSVLPNEKWWEMNQFWEEHFTFQCQYFDYNYGDWRNREFYCGDRKAKPFGVNSDTGIPLYMTNCECNVIDTGR